MMCRPSVLRLSSVGTEGSGIESSASLRQRFENAPLLSLGFRPFYLLAAVFALLGVPVWIMFWLGVVEPGTYLAGMAWHGHEMVFGFAAAVITGFLLTAVRNWTSLPTPTGVMLAGLALLWLLARVLMLTGPGALAAAVDTALLPALGVAIGVPIWRSRNTRNYKILLLLAALMGLNVLFHLAHLNVVSASLERTALLGALDLIAILIAVVGGRVIPAFTENAFPALRLQRVMAVETVAVGALVLVFVAGLLRPWFALPGVAWVALLALAAAAHFARLMLWQPLKTRRNPLLWMLPAAYAWIPVALMLRALAEAGKISPIAATHALTIGAMTGMMMAMMMRSALGHTGRSLAAGPAEIAAFLLVQLAAMVRVFAGILWPESYQVTVMASGVLWSLAFAVFLVRFAPMLARARVS